MEDIKNTVKYEGAELLKPFTNWERNPYSSMFLRRKCFRVLQKSILILVCEEPRKTCCENRQTVKHGKYQLFRNISCKLKTLKNQEIQIPNFRKFH